MTAMTLYRQCKTAGIELSAQGDRMRFKAPAGVAIPTDELRTCKGEMLHLLAGDYLHAALELVVRQPEDRRPDLAHDFDQRVRSMTAGGTLPPDAHKAAYCAIARRIEAEGSARNIPDDAALASVRALGGKGGAK